MISSEFRKLGANLDKVCYVALTIVGVIMLPPTFKILLIIASLAVILYQIFRYYSVPKDLALTPVTSLGTNPDNLIFVYGSLLVERSLQRTIGRPPRSIKCVPAVLSDYKLTWDAWQGRVDYMDNQWAPIPETEYWSYLGAEKAPGESVFGAVISVDNQELRALCNRELHYELTEVLGVEPYHSDATLPAEKIRAFIPRTAPGARRSAPIRRSYFDSVSNALRALGMPRLKRPRHLTLQPAKLIDEEANRVLRTSEGEQILESARAKISNHMRSAAEKPERKRAFGLAPIILPRKIFKEAMNIAEAIVSLTTDTMEVLHAKPDIIRWAGFNEVDTELLRHALNQGSHAPQIARIDMTFCRNRLYVFEVNSDSPGGLHHIDIVSHGQAKAIENSSLHWVEAVPSLVSDACVDAILESAARFRRQPVKTCRIVESEADRWPTYPEMQHFEDEIRRRGKLNTRILDLKHSQLVYQDGFLREHADAPPIDLIYKRILWRDMHAVDSASAAALRESYLNDDVCVVNSLGSQISSSKFIQAMMKAPEFESWIDEVRGQEGSLSSAERHVVETALPDTYIWGHTPPDVQWSQQETLKSDVLMDIQDFVAKPFNEFGGKDVLVGLNREVKPADFEHVWDKEGMDKRIVQRYVPHGCVTMPVWNHDGEVVKWKNHFFILGVYVVNGRAVAIEAKTGPKLPINMKNECYRTAVFPTRQ